MHAFTWSDIPTLYRNRKNILVLDHKMLVNYGNPLGAMALIQHLNPERESYTAVSATPDGEASLVGQIYRLAGARAVHLSYVLPITSCSTSALPSLIEGFAKEAGKWGVYSMLAEVNERNMALGCFKRAGFSVYAWQRIWKPVNLKGDTSGEALWQPAGVDDELHIQNLFHSLVPPLVQRAQEIMSNHSYGLVYYKKKSLQGYIEITTGPKGLYLFPLIHPETENVTALMKELFNALQSPSNEDVCMAVPSYQSWLEGILTDIGLEATPRQALMVRYLTQVNRVAIHTSPLAVIENRKTETSALLPNCSKEH